MNKQLFDERYFNKIFSVEEYNNKKNIELRSNINDINYSEVDELYSLLDQYKQSRVNKNLLNIINSKIEVERYSIKGICYKDENSLSFINNYLESFIDKKRYDYKFFLSKIFNKKNNKIISSEKNKYKIILLNIKEDEKNILEKNLINFRKAVLLFTNLVANLKFDNKSGQFQFEFSSTLNTKIYMEKNGITDPINAKTNFNPSGIFIDYLKSNEFSYIDWISTQKLYSLKDSRFKEKFKKGFKFELCLDLKLYLEIKSESLYLENLKDEFLHFYPYYKENINLCGFVKNIYKDKTRKTINVILENIFDLNNIILEIPQNDPISQNLYINCIYLFFDLIIFMDEKMNIKLKTQNYLTSQSRIILLYFLIDPEKYMNKKLDDHLFQSQFSQLLPLITENKITRIFYKYLVNINKVNYMNIYFSKDNVFAYYDLYLHCSDGTSSAFCHIKGKDLVELKKLNININTYLNNRNNTDRNLITVFPQINEDIQIIIIGKPISEGLKELSFLNIYENINELKKYENFGEEKKINLNKFDLLLTKNEFIPINGTFIKNSKSLEPIPVIKVIKFMTLNEYMTFIELQKKTRKDI